MWKRLTEGLRHHYLYGLAVDSGDPNNVIVSASVGPTLLKTLSHLYIEGMKMTKNGRLMEGYILLDDD